MTDNSKPARSIGDLFVPVHANIGDRPVVYRATEALGISKAAAIGHLVMFWGKAAQYLESGDMDHCTEQQIEEWAGWRGKRGRFAQFVLEQHCTDGRINEWSDYAGKLAAKRTYERDKKRRQRHGVPRDVPGTVPPLSPSSPRQEVRSKKEELRTKSKDLEDGGGESLDVEGETTESPPPPTAVMKTFVAMMPEKQRGGWRATIQSWRSGLNYANGRKASDDDIAQGLTEYLASTPEPDFKVNHVRGFVLNAEQKRLSVGVPPAVSARANGHGPGPSKIDEFMAGVTAAFRVPLPEEQ